MGPGQGLVSNWQPKLRNLFIYDEISSRFVCSASVHKLASADGSMDTQFNYADKIHCSWLIMFFFTQNLHSSDRMTGESVSLILGLFLPVWDNRTSG